MSEYDRLKTEWARIAKKQQFKMEKKIEQFRAENERLNSELLGILQLACDVDEVPAEELISKIAIKAAAAHKLQHPKEPDNG